MDRLSLESLPDELLLHILCFLDIPELLATSRVRDGQADQDNDTC